MRIPWRRSQPLAFELPVWRPLSEPDVDTEANYNDGYVLHYGKNNEQFTLRTPELIKMIEPSRYLIPLATATNGEVSESVLGLQNLFLFISQTCPKIARHVQAQNLYILKGCVNKEAFATINTRLQCESVTLNSSLFMNIWFDIILKKFKIDETTSLLTTTILLDVVHGSGQIDRVYFCYLLVNYMLLCNRFKVGETVRYSIAETRWLSEKIENLITITRHRPVWILSDQTTNTEYVLMNIHPLDETKIQFLQKILDKLCPTTRQPLPFFTDSMLMLLFSIETAVIHIPVLTFSIFFWNLKSIFKRIDIEEKGHQRMELLGIKVPLRSWNKLAVVCIAVILVLMSSYEGTRIFNLLHGDDWELSQFVWHNWWGRVLLGATLISSGFTALWYFKGNGRNLLS
ncbi:hypothetical protein WICPIJ_009571 [Wickerhamomyces pijperi]|uniref:Uncharacterized protein n=1 Tax=Wickerhamomyces pijperi TaxID=599730 RepID=A0A9P8PMY6_WICPI|nr:hypothetical protein WICPIJ_009571 [Wickerhamomyces pijperi]